MSEGPVVGPDRRVGMRIPLGPSLGMAPTTGWLGRVLEEGGSVGLVMEIAGYRTPYFRTLKDLAKLGRGQWLRRIR